MKKACVLVAALACRLASGAADEVRGDGMIPFLAITGRPTQAEVCAKVAAMDAQGIESFVLYARSGLQIEYMGEEWLDFVGHMLREAKSVGGHIWLYDEYNWPSGSCRGRVPMENPEWTYTEYAVRRRDDGSFDWEVKRNDQLSMRCF